MTQPVVQLRRRGFGETMRRDAWWLPPLGVFVVLSSFLAYATWAAFQNAHYEYGNYLSPFYSPLLFGASAARRGSARSRAWLAVPISPALLILPFPAGFRFTCYYYRGAYYKAFWADPPSCAVGEPRKSYLGERTLPLVLQNIHRYFLYFALLFLLVLAHDAWKASGSPIASGATRVRHRRRLARAGDQRRPARRLHARLPLAAASRRRLSRPAVAAAPCARRRTTA